MGFGFWLEKIGLSIGQNLGPPWDMGRLMLNEYNNVSNSFGLKQSTRFVMLAIDSIHMSSWLEGSQISYTLVFLVAPQVWEINATI